MRFISISISLSIWLSCAAVVSAQHKIREDNKATETETAMPEYSLQLRTSVADKKICANDSLQLTLRLHYKNVGERSIILYKNSNGISRVLVSRDTRSAAKTKYEYDAPQYLFTKLIPKPIDAPAPSDSLFIILNPGDSYEIEETPVFFVGPLRTGD